MDYWNTYKYNNWSISIPKIEWLNPIPDIKLTYNDYTLSSWYYDGFNLSVNGPEGDIYDTYGTPVYLGSASNVVIAIQFYAMCKLGASEIDTELNSVLSTLISMVDSERQRTVYGDHVRIDLSRYYEMADKYLIETLTDMNH